MPQSSRVTAPKKRKMCGLYRLLVRFSPLTWMLCLLRDDYLAISNVRISFCEHSPPAVSLVQLGAFSSTPIRPPAWAFDIVLLEYMSKQFAYGTPDVTAWCNATCSFLSSQGVEKVPTPVRLLTVCSCQTSLPLFHPRMRFTAQFSPLYCIISLPETESAV